MAKEAKSKILIVDDDGETRELLSCLLTSEGYEIDEAGCADEFQKQAFAKKPDLIILDIMLGDKNGPLVYEKLLKEGLDSKIPVIFLSGLVEDHPPSPAQEGRLFALRAKPFQLNELLNDISCLLSRKK